MPNRCILHSDANCFYASVEMLLNPELRGKAVAVCGSTEDRHGIVLARSEKAKKAGVKTGQANWEARQACPGLIVVPPHYDQYCKFSRLLRNIYLRYTDLVEPYGMDECWLDVTGSERLMGSGEKIAEEIRQSVREELGITVSIGVSFNKIFAKLGSDMKKPDAITVLDDDNWRERIWPIPVSELLYVGRSTARKLMDRCVYTIGDLARTDPTLLTSWFGKNGLGLWGYSPTERTTRGSGRTVTRLPSSPLGTASPVPAIFITTRRSGRSCWSFRRTSGAGCGSTTCAAKASGSISGKTSWTA